MRIGSDSLNVLTAFSLASGELVGADGDVSCGLVDLVACSPDDSDGSGIDGGTAQDVFLCVDVSGSMCGTEPTLRRVVLSVAQALKADDRLVVVTFNHNASESHFYFFSHSQYILSPQLNH